MTRCVAFIQARMSSTRLPGKVLAPLGGVPSIEFMVRRARQARRLADVVVVTSVDPSDDLLERHLLDAGVKVFRGALSDVLSRYAAAAAAYPAQEYLRLTGDCPLIDPAVIDAVIDARRSAEVDYSSNVDPPTYPDGLDCECFSAEALHRAHAAAIPGPEREHVTLWMRKPASGLSRVNTPLPFDASHLRLTVDYADDLAAVRKLLAHLPPDGRFDTFDLLRAIAAHPEIAAMNPHARNEGLAAATPTPKEPSP